MNFRVFTNNIPATPPVAGRLCQASDASQVGQNNAGKGSGQLIPESEKRAISHFSPEIRGQSRILCPGGQPIKSATKAGFSRTLSHPLQVAVFRTGKAGECRSGQDANVENVLLPAPVLSKWGAFSSCPLSRSPQGPLATRRAQKARCSR